ncbi:MAG: diguanylate cyclase [Actinomycetota bacterium]
MPDPQVLPDVVLTTPPLEGPDPYLELVHPDDLESLAALVDLALSDAHAIVRVRDHDGGWTLVEHRARTEPDRVVLERTDVTEREQERARQGRTDAYWRTILRNGHEAIAVLDPSTHRIRHASDHLGELLDTDPQWLERRTLASLVHPDDEAVFERCLDALDASDGRLVTEVRLFSLDAGPRWMEAVLSDARHDPDVAAIVVNLRDIEDRKKAEQQLRSSEQLFRVLLGHLADGALVVDRDGTVRFASTRAAEILRVQVDDLVGDVVPLRTRGDGTVALSTDVRLDPVSLAHLPVEIAGAGDRWYELTTHDLGDDPVVDGLVLVLRDITQRRRDVEQLRHELELDDLTGLANRRGFEQRVTARIDDGERLHLAFLDLNGFKAVNDTHGHGVGDELLRRVAERLRRATRPDDVVARLGGDEFVVAAAVTDHALRDELIDRLARALSGAYQLQEHRVRLSVSTGWSEVGGEVGLDEALRTADARMYADKRWQADLDRRAAG